MQSKLLSLLGVSVVAIAAAIRAQPATANGSNCWFFPNGQKYVNMRFIRSDDRCTMPVFHLIDNEYTRNIRATPNGPVVGQMTQGCAYGLFFSNHIATEDNGRTYWAQGYTMANACDQTGEIVTGWVEVGNTAKIRQIDRQYVNDVWFKF